ncbi:MAG: TolC family protein [Cyclobacteriaceae bacterium]
MLTKKIKLSILLCLFTVSNILAQTQEIDVTAPLTLDECLTYAYQNSENIKIADLEKTIAQAEVGITKAQGLPQVDLAVVYNNNFAVPTIYLPAEAGAAFGQPGDEEVELNLGIRNEANAGISASQMIFDGSYFVGLAAARTFVNLSEQDYILTKNDVAEQVTKAYYAALIDEFLENLVLSNLQRVDTLLRETKLMYENGFVEKIDVDRISVQFNNIKTELDRVKRSSKLSVLLLKFQMGMPIEQEITLADKLSEIDFDPEVEADQGFNYTDRAEYAQLLINQDLVQLDMRNTRAQRLPKLTLVANYGYNTGTDDFTNITNLNRWNPLGSFGVNLSIPVFDGLRKYHTIQKSKVQMQQLELQSSFLQNSIDLEIEQARVNLNNSVEQMENQLENYELAQEVYRVSKIKYQEGVGSNIVVIDAENSLISAQTNYFQALYNAIIAKVGLQRALGILVQN